MTLFSVPLLSAHPSAPPMDSLSALIEARMHDPFQVLGWHPAPGPRGGRGSLLRVFRPHAREVEVEVEGRSHPLARTHEAGMFELRLPAAKISHDIPYTLRIDGVNSADPYAFAPQPR